MDVWHAPAQRGFSFKTPLVSCVEGKPARKIYFEIGQLSYLIAEG
jgi:hypothetical protein